MTSGSAVEFLPRTEGRMVAVVADEERSRVKQSEAERMQHKIAPFFVV